MKIKMMIRRKAFLFMWLTICVSGCTFLRGMVNPDYHTQRYKSHVYVKHDKPPIENFVLRSEGFGIPYYDHPDLFQDGVNPSPNDGLVDVSVIARPADESPQKASPFMLQLSERAQQAVVQSFGQLQGDRKNLLGLLQTLRERAKDEKGRQIPAFDLKQKVEFDIATTLNSGTDTDRLDYVTTYIALDDDSAKYFSFTDIQDVEREAQELIIGEISKSIAAGGKLAFQGAATPAGTPSAEVSANVTEGFRKEFRQRFMARTVSIDGKKKYFRVTQRATQEHPIEGLKRYVLALAIKPSLSKDALFTPMFSDTDSGKLEGLMRD
ncbi:MAG: hypothetical protein HY278_01000, partial [candidate division NC10 bacterium]|nr:hypothetical protein [candidate division NC10 bacterium]